MNNNGQLDFLDLISIMSFCIAIMNLDENISQGDLADSADTLLNEIHGHLQEQDIKLDHIIKRLEEIENGSSGNIRQVIRTHDKRNDDT